MEEEDVLIDEVLELDRKEDEELELELGREGAANR